MHNHKLFGTLILVSSTFFLGGGRPVSPESTPMDLRMHPHKNDRNTWRPTVLPFSHVSIVYTSGTIGMCDGCKSSQRPPVCLAELMQVQWIDGHVAMAHSAIDYVACLTIDYRIGLNPGQNTPGQEPPPDKNLQSVNAK